MFLVWVLFLLFERDSPEDAGLPPMVEEVEVESEVLTEDIPEDGWKKMCF